MTSDLEIYHRTTSTDAFCGGAAPVSVGCPQEGQPLAFEKLTARDEVLWVSFTYRGLTS
jgi:hypothetical protein